MPAIKEYTSQVNAPGAVERRAVSPAAFGAPIGQGMQELGQSIENATDYLYKHQAQKEVSNLSAKMAQARADWTISATERIKKADPNDSDFSKNFLTEYDEYMDKMGEGLETGPAKDYFLRANTEMRADFEKSTWAAQSELAGLAAVQNWKTQLNSLTSSARANPSAMNSLQAQAAISLEAQVQLGLPRDKALVLQTEAAKDIAVESLRGWMAGDPKKARAELDSKKYDALLGGEVKDQLYGEIRTTERAIIADAELARVQAEKAKKVRQDGLGKEFFADLEAGKMTTKRLITEDKWKELDSFGEGSLNSMISVIERYNNSGGKIQSNPSVKADVWNRIHNLPPGDARAITDVKQLVSLYGNGLDETDMKFFRGEIQDRGTPEGTMKADLKKQLLAQARAELVRPPAFGLPDPKGEENYTKYMGFALQELDRYEKQGKDPMELLDPSNKNSLHKKILSYKKTNTDMMAERRAEQKVINDKSKGLTPQKIGLYTMDELSQLAPEGLTQEQLDAARRRFNELAPLGKQK